MRKFSLKKEEKGYSLLELFDYKMDKLEESEKKRIEELLKGDGKIKKDLEEVEKITELLSEWKIPEYPSELDEKVISSIKVQKKGALNEFLANVFHPLSIAVSLALLTLFAFIAIFFKTLFPPQEVREREIEISFKISEAKKPVIVEVENLEEGFEKIVRIIDSYGGKLIGKRKVKEGIEIKFSVDKETEEEIFREISLLGKMKMGKEGFKDKKGNIVLIISKMEKNK